MKKFTSMLVLSLFLSLGAFAQSRNITGTVVSGTDLSPVIGATVIIEGTDNGAITDYNGQFEVINANGAVNLEVSMMGYETAIIAVAANQTTAEITINESALAVDDVVVTGLGISREKRALGYAVQEVDGEELTKVRTSNVVGALSGRVAGVQISQATGQIGGGAKINIRGNTSLTGDNQPLFVVDGIPISNADNSEGAAGGGGYDLGNMAGDLNSDDIESMSILKGASATAIYGSRGANGVVLITTKKANSGTSNKSFGVSFNSQFTMEKAGIMPVYQKSYGGGYGLETAEINGKTYNLAQYRVDESWGPAYDESTMYLPWNAFDETDPDNYLKEISWTYPENDYHDYYETGFGAQNNIQIQGADQKFSYRLSYTNLKQTGITPNSELLRHTVAFNGTAKLNDYVDSWVSFNYVENKAQGRPETGYGDRAGGKLLWQWGQTNLDYDAMKNYKNPDGTQRTWNRTAWNNSTPYYSDNVYWSAYENYQNDRRDRIYGNTGINITPMEGMKITARGGMDTYTTTSEERIADGSQSQSEYVLVDRWRMETTFDVFGTYNNRFANDKIGFSAMFGASSNDRKSSLTGGYTSGGLLLPGIYNLSNSTSTAISYDSKYHRRTNSIYGNATIDYNQLIYLDVTARNDWSSTLSSSSWSYFYPSLNLSFVLSELEAFKNIEWLSFAKLRGGWAQVGNDTDEYVLSNYYDIGYSYNGNPQVSTSTTLNNSDLLPEMTKSWEVGLDARFFHDRLGIDLAYYEKKTVDQIVPVTISSTTGYQYTYINAGQMSNKGIEATINGTLIRSKSGFTWDMQFNMATLKNKVDYITDDLTYINLGSAPFNVQSGAMTGSAYPIIYGTDYVYDDNGNKIVDEDGYYEYSDITDIGKVTPDFTAGLSTSLSYKGFDLFVQFDMQMGGHMYYTSYLWGMYSGMLDESAMATNVPNVTGDIREHGYILDGVTADGSANTTVISGYDYATLSYSIDAMNVFKTDYIKLREVRFGYTFPRSMTGPIKDIRLSVFGRNLATFMTDQQHFDPEYLQAAGSNAQGIEGGYVPTTRTFGFGLSFNF